MKNRHIMSIICFFISCCLLAACGGDSGAASAVTSFTSTPTDQKTDPMPSGSVSTDPVPVVPPVSVPTEDSGSEPYPVPTDPSAINGSIQGPLNPVPNRSPFGGYPRREDIQELIDNHHPDNPLFFYPTNSEMSITKAPGAEDIVSYAENLGWQQYTGDDNLNFFHGGDSWDSSSTMSRVSYYAPEGYFVICIQKMYNGSPFGYDIFYLYMDTKMDTFGSNLFTVELADFMKSLLDKVMAVEGAETNTPITREFYYSITGDYGYSYWMVISHDFATVGLTG